MADADIVGGYMQTKLYVIYHIVITTTALKP